MSLADTRDFLDCARRQFNLLPPVYDTVHVYWNQRDIRITWDEYVDMCLEVQYYYGY